MEITTIGLDLAKHIKVDLVGPKSRGLAVGLNEFAGYLAVGLTALATGYIASIYGLRPAPIYLGIAYAIIGLALSVLLVRDTREHVALEAEDARARRRSAVDLIRRGVWNQLDRSKPVAHLSFGMR